MSDTTSPNASLFWCCTWTSNNTHENCCFQALPKCCKLRTGGRSYAIRNSNTTIHFEVLELFSCNAMQSCSSRAAISSSCLDLPHGHELNLSRAMQFPNAIHAKWCPWSGSLIVARLIQPLVFGNALFQHCGRPWFCKALFLVPFESGHPRYCPMWIFIIHEHQGFVWLVGRSVSIEQHGDGLHDVIHCSQMIFNDGNLSLKCLHAKTIGILPSCQIVFRDAPRTAASGSTVWIAMGWISLNIVAVSVQAVGVPQNW